MLSVNESGNLKIQRRKCRLMKKSDLVKIAQNMGVNTTKKTKPQICASMKAQPLTIDQATKRIMAMKSLTKPKRQALVMRMRSNKSMSPRRYVKLAREMGRMA